MGIVREFPKDGVTSAQGGHSAYIGRSHDTEELN